MRITKAFQSSAHHEAGHAVVAWDQGIAIRKLLLVPDLMAGGGLQYRNPLLGANLDEDKSDRTRLRAEKVIRVCFAGGAAQRRFYQRSKWRAGRFDDLVHAAGIAFAIAASGEEARAHLKLREIQAGQIVEFHWAAIEAVAHGLLERRKMTGKEVRAVIFDTLAER